MPPVASNEEAEKKKKDFQGKGRTGSIYSMALLSTLKLVPKRGKE